MKKNKKIGEPTPAALEEPKAVEGEQQEVANAKPAAPAPAAKPKKSLNSIMANMNKLKSKSTKKDD